MNFNKIEVFEWQWRAKIGKRADKRADYKKVRCDCGNFVKRQERRRTPQVCKRGVYCGSE